VVSAHWLSGVRKPGSVGQPIPGVEVSILDDGDRRLPTGEVGEVCMRGPSVMQGYYRMPDETARALRAGWLHTGDMGRLDADGFLYIVERKKDLIIRGGIYPREVEEVLAFVALRPGAAADVGALIASCQDRLAKYKCPRQIRVVDALPKSPIGKILRSELRRLAG
jgi:long-chain acyl-CoA synthetase